jgi:hypothetical protein
MQRKRIDCRTVGIDPIFNTLQHGYSLRCVNCGRSLKWTWNNKLHHRRDQVRTKPKKESNHGK